MDPRFQFRFQHPRVVSFGSVVGCRSLPLFEDMSPIPDHWECAGIGRGLVEGQSHDYFPDDDAVSLEGSEADTEPGTDVPTPLPDPTPRAAAAEALLSEMEATGLKVVVLAGVV